MMAFKTFAISILYWMSMNEAAWSDPRIIVTVYLTRTCIINSCYPLQKSILMDYVPKNARAKWNSLESITSFGWSGSAFMGGYLIQHFGFGPTFATTATVQLLAVSLLILLLPLVPRSETSILQTAEAASRRPTDGGADAAQPQQAIASPGVIREPERAVAPWPANGASRMAKDSQTQNRSGLREPLLPPAVASISAPIAQTTTPEHHAIVLRKQ